MLSLLKSRAKYSGKDHKIAMRYAQLVNGEDWVGAESVLLGAGWTKEKVDDVLDHFYPKPTDTDTDSGLAIAPADTQQLPRVYTYHQISVAIDASRTRRLHSEDEATMEETSKVLEAVGLSWGDVDLAREHRMPGEDNDTNDSYESSPEPEDEASYTSEIAEPASAPQGVERKVVSVHPNYTDSIDDRAVLIAVLWRKFGDGWQVEAHDKAASTVDIIRGELPAMRPRAAVYELGPSASASNGEATAVKHAASGRTMLSYDPYKRQAETAVLPQATMDLRERFLRNDSKQKSWELELLPLFSVTDGVGHLDRVIITRANKAAMDRNKEVAYWLQIARTVVGHEGWRVEVDAKTGRIEMIHGIRPELPRLVPGNSILPAEINTKDWSNFVVGLDSKKEKVCVSLEAGPHSLVIGGTGAGKSCTLRVIILNALARGFEVVIIDPSKQAAGLLGIEPWTKGIFIKDLDEAAGALNAVYKEVRRRVDMITEVRGENWRDLPAGTVKPILVVVDEYSALVTPDSKPIGLERTDPLMVEWSADASARAQIQNKVGKIAKEARSAGVHLVIATQRPDASDIGGNVRENLGTIIQMVPPSRPPSPDALRMVFPSEYVSMATEEIGLLNDGRSRGFALSYIEGGGIQGIRVGLVEKEDMEMHAERLNIPFGEPLDIAESGPRPFEVVETSYVPEAPTVRELGELELSLEDLEDDDDIVVVEAPQAPEPDWRASAVPAVAQDDDEDFFAPAAKASKPRSVPADDEDLFAAAPAPKSRPSLVEDDDPFGEPAPKPKPKVEVAFEW